MGTVGAFSRAGMGVVSVFLVWTSLGFANAAPIEIESVIELQFIGHDMAYPLAGDYVLMRDLDASAT